MTPKPNCTSTVQLQLVKCLTDLEVLRRPLPYFPHHHPMENMAWKAAKSLDSGYLPQEQPGSLRAGTFLLRSAESSKPASQPSRRALKHYPPRCQEQCAARTGTTD